ncbi:MAG: efflux RND transporter periplasmic adaptor subunit [Xanthobacteraceae bacterium]|nr:MAG: efflux RND transporter periplasmic adaptor subunit [Xanthobacteraceae bacterium]
MTVARLFCILALASGLAACGQDKTKEGGAPPAPTVTVARPMKKVVTDHDEYVGRFVAIESIEVRARVSGYLEAIHFRDGQMVKKGDLLFSLDRRPFEATLAQAQAARSQAEANLAFAEADLARGQNLTRGSGITQQAFEQRMQARRVAAATLAAQDAAVRQATLDVEFTELRAPVSGRIGDRRVAAGNLVTGGTSGNTTLLATITSIDPIRFEFTVDEASYLRYLRAAGNPTGDNRDLSIPARLRLINETAFVHEGKTDFVDNVIDPASGTIRLRAEFANPDGTLTPGMFGRIQIAAGPPRQALLVPDAAIGTEQVRKFVLVADAGNVARPKYVELGSVIDGQRVIATGLEPDDRVIVNGLMRVRPGMRVTPQDAADATAADGRAPAGAN